MRVGVGCLEGAVEHLVELTPQRHNVGSSSQLCFLTLKQQQTGRQWRFASERRPTATAALVHGRPMMSTKPQTPPPPTHTRCLPIMCGAVYRLIPRHTHPRSHKVPPCVAVRRVERFQVRSAAPCAQTQRARSSAAPPCPQRGALLPQRLSHLERLLLPNPISYQ